MSTDLTHSVSAFLNTLHADPHIDPHIDPHADPHIDPHADPHIDPHADPHVDLHIVLGVSGGIDSTVLLHVLHHLAPYHHLKLVVAHAHHGLRDVEADDDERFVIALCDDYGIPCVTDRLHVHQHAEGSGKGLEASARTLRYDFFARVARDHGARLVAVGHTADDVAETMIMHLARASGIDGLSAHRAVRTLDNGMTVIRPLINVQRSDVVNYATSHGLRWREDTSNTDAQFLRNVVRADIMPALRSVFGSDVGTRMALSSSLLADAAQIVHTAINDRLNNIVAINETLTIDIDALTTQEHFFHREIIREALFRWTNEHPSFNDVARVIELIRSEAGSMASLSGDRIALREREHVIVSLGTRHLAPGTWHLALLSDGSYVAGSSRLTLRTQPVADVVIVPDTDVAYVDADRISGTLTWRPWSNGDRFIPFGMTQSVLVSDLLTNAKVPFSTRRNIRVVADDEGILWVCGIRPAERTRITNATQNVLTLTSID